MGDDLNLEFKLRVQLLMRFKNKFSKNEKNFKKKYFRITQKNQCQLMVHDELILKSSDRTSLMSCNRCNVQVIT